MKELMPKMLAALDAGLKISPDSELHNAIRAAIAAEGEPVSALTRYNETIAETGDSDMGGPLERLRFFCALSMPGRDWLYVEPFFAAVEKEQAAPMTEEEILVRFDEIVNARAHDSKVIAFARVIEARKARP